MRIKDDKLNFIGLWIKNFILKKNIEIWGNPKIFRDHLYIDDCIKALLLTIRNNPSKYILSLIVLSGVQTFLMQISGSNF